MMESLRPILLIVAAASAGGLLGFVLLRNGWLKAYGAFVAAHIFAIIGLMLALRTPGQADGVLYTVFLVFFMLPSLFGIALGGAVAWWMRRRQAK